MFITEHKYMSLKSNTLSSIFFVLISFFLNNGNIIFILLLHVIRLKLILIVILQFQSINNI